MNPTRIEINEGDNVTLFCNVSGTGVSSMTWNTDNMTSLHNTSTFSNRTLTLHIYNVSTSDHFLIPTCLVSNDTDFIQVGVRLHVLRKPFSLIPLSLSLSLSVSLSLFLCLSLSLSVCLSVFLSNCINKKFIRA